MKLGYSLLLGEFIEAEKVEYEDCKKFQITCPGCNEPVFKGVKVFPAKDNSTHYFAHYEKSKSVVAECELRIGSLAPQEIAQAQAESRNQRLEYFLKVFSDTVNTMLKTTSQGFDNPEKLWWIINKIKRSKPVTIDLFNLVYEAHKIGFAKMTDAELDEIFDFYIDEFGIDYLEKYSKKSFSIVTQKRIARDFYRHLISAPARDNFKLLYIAGYFMTFYRMLISLHTKKPITEDFEPMLNNMFFQLPEANRKKGQSLIYKMATTQIHYRYGRAPSISLLAKVQTEISHEMFGVLLKLEYLEILKKSKQSNYGNLNDSIIA